MKRPYPHLPITGTCEEEAFFMPQAASFKLQAPNKFQIPSTIRQLADQTNYKSQAPNPKQIPNHKSQIPKNQEPGTKNQEPGTKNPEPGTWNPKQKNNQQNLIL